MKYLSRKDIEIIGNRVIRAYMRLPDFVGKTIYRITPDVLIRDVLGLNLEYHHLSLDGSVLGLTTAYSDVAYKVFDCADEESYCKLDGKTILIERDLNDDVSQVGRCNFTKSHEACYFQMNMAGAIKKYISVFHNRSHTKEWIGRNGKQMELLRLYLCRKK